MAQLLFDEIKGFWNRSRPTIIYPAYIMRILKLLKIPSYLSGFVEMSIKYSGTKFFKLMRLLAEPPTYITFLEWTAAQQQQGRHIEQAQEPHHEQ